MKILDQYNINALSKILYQMNIMPSGNSQSFIKLSKLLITHFQNGYDYDKIKRVISSELISTYGLSVNENEVDQVAEEVRSWYIK